MTQRVTLGGTRVAVARAPVARASRRTVLTCAAKQQVGLALAGAPHSSRRWTGSVDSLGH